MVETVSGRVANVTYVYVVCRNIVHWGLQELVELKILVELMFSMECVQYFWKFTFMLIPGSHTEGDKLTVRLLKVDTVEGENW